MASNNLFLICNHFYLSSFSFSTYFQQTFSICLCVIRTMSSLRNYKRNILASKDVNFFILPWECVLQKNCAANGELLMFKSMKEYKEQTKCLWLLLKLVFFRDNVNNKCNLNYIMILYFVLGWAVFCFLLSRMWFHEVCQWF